MRQAIRAQARTLRSGFTLAELLVLIAIIGIPVALLLSSIQAARPPGPNVQTADRVLVTHEFGFHQGSRIEKKGGWNFGRWACRDWPIG